MSQGSSKPTATVDNAAGAAAVNIQDGGNSITVDGSVSSLITGPFDAFSRFRVSNPDSVFESTFQWDLQPNLYNATTANSGAITHKPLISSAELATAAVASSSAIMQSKAYFRYLPGKSQFIIMTFVMNDAVANVVKRAGYFDANDGVFLEQNGTTDVAFTLRTSTSGSPSDSNRVVQANWNIDPFNGSGPSGVTLDLSKGQILVIDLQWLGMGRVRVGFDIAGTIYYAHQFLNANVLAVPYMKTACLPVRWEAAGNGVATMNATCATVVSEGGTEADQGFIFTAGTDLTAVTFSTTPTPVVALRPATTFNSIANRIENVLQHVSYMVSSGTTQFHWQVMWNTAITGGSWSAVSGTNMEKNVSGTAITGGIPIDSGYDDASNATRAQFNANAHVARYPWCYDGTTQIVIAFVCTSASSNISMNACMEWRELR